MRSWAAACELVTLWEFNYENFSFSLSLSCYFWGFFFLQGKVCCDTGFVQPTAWVLLPSLKSALLVPIFTAVGMIRLWMSEREKEIAVNLV